MPKFSEDEKEQIRQKLLSTGKELFAKYGLGKTSIDDIVIGCGIGKGSFYKFYSSKEELFYAILKSEEDIRDRLLGELLRENMSPKELISSFFHTALRLADENPFLQTIFEDGEYERIIRKLPKHLIEEASQNNTEKGIFFIQKLMDRGVLREEDPELIVGVIRAILLLRLHKEKIGNDMFPKIMELIIDYIAQGLTERQESNIK